MRIPSLGRFSGTTVPHHITIIMPPAAMPTTTHITHYTLINVYAPTCTTS